MPSCGHRERSGETRPNRDPKTEPMWWAEPFRPISHVAEVAQPLHQVLFVLGAAGALGRPLEVL